VKQTIFAVAALAVAAALPASAQIGSTTITNITQATYNVAQAYPCTISGYTANLGISSLRTWRGACESPLLVNGAAPGTICLRRPAGTFALDVNCFAIVPPNQFGPCFVQSWRLIKQVPGSFKCPDVYGTPHFDFSKTPPVFQPYQYYQIGSGVRTWWSLNFTQPGTQFLLEVISVCRGSGTVGGVPGDPRVHKDTWIWRVVADVNTLANLIELMHGGAVSTLEVPCILGEDMYDALKSANATLAGAVNTGDRAKIGNAIFDMEALIVANCLFVEVLNPVVSYPGPKQFDEPAGFQPPGNLAQTVFFGTGGSAVAGILDTIENPCCCKLLVDLEWIALKQGIVGQMPTLPTF